SPRHGFSEHDQADWLVARTLCMVALRRCKDWTYTHLQHDDRQLFHQLQACSHLLTTVSQRMNEKNVIIHNLQENFGRERSAMRYQISTLKMQLAVEEQKVKMAAREQEIVNGEEGEEGCRDGVAEITKPEVGPEQAEEQRSKSKSLDTERHKVEHRALEPKSQKGQVQVLVQRRLERAVSQSPPAAEVESWQSARETVSPSVEHAPQQGQRQGQRKRKRALRGDCCS
ncbi:hypothetical protein N0V95_010011, partial [Ascochyta clinopodiicola]